MPFYQLLCITAHYDKYEFIKKLVHGSAMVVLNGGGVVRKINSWGTLTLPQRMKRHGTQGQYHTIADYWTMHFDASPLVMRRLNSKMQHDPSVVRWTVTKLGEKVEDVIHSPESTVKRH